MLRYLVLLKFTSSGMANVRESHERAEAFRASASQAGAKVEAQYWTIGPYDGALVITAPDEATATGVVLGLGKSGHVSTCMLRAFDAKEFEAILNKSG